MVSTKLSTTVCSAIECRNSRMRAPLMSFFRFPKDPERCMRWVINSRRQDLLDRMKKDGPETARQLYKSNMLCAKHFEDNQFMNITQRNKLIHSGVPTLFNNRNPLACATNERKSPCEIKQEICTCNTSDSHLKESEVLHDSSCFASSTISTPARFGSSVEERKSPCEIKQEICSTSNSYLKESEVLHDSSCFASSTISTPARFGSSVEERKSPCEIKQEICSTSNSYLKESEVLHDSSCFASSTISTPARFGSSVEERKSPCEIKQEICSTSNSHLKESEVLQDSSCTASSTISTPARFDSSVEKRKSPCEIKQEICSTSNSYLKESEVLQDSSCTASSTISTPAEFGSSVERKSPCRKSVAPVILILRKAECCTTSSTISTPARFGSSVEEKKSPCEIMKQKICSTSNSHLKKSKVQNDSSCTASSTISTPARFGSCVDGASATSTAESHLQRVQMKLCETQKKVNALRKKLIRKDKKIAAQNQKIAAQNQKIKNMQEEIQNQFLKPLPAPLQAFIRSQLNSSRRAKTGRRWSIIEKKLAITLYRSSPKTYRILQKLFILPSIMTMKRTMQARSQVAEVQ